MALVVVSDAGFHVLALNSGSSSLKFGLYRVDADGVEAVLSGEAEALGSSAGRFRVRDATGALLCAETVAIADGVQAFVRFARLLAELHVPLPDAIGHRVVHGGAALRRHARIDKAVLDQLQAATAFAPLHVPAALAVIHAARERFADVPQVACLDTAFHADLPELTRTLPIDRTLRAEGVQRFGFHGLSCASILAQWQGPLPQRLVIAHLGSGASVTAIREGVSVDTSMGMTPNGGVMMATRCGDLDPGVLAYLGRERGMDAPTLERLVDHRSGLLGVSGISGDLRSLRAMADSHADARLAIDMFVLSVRKQIAAMAATLGGMDALVFTGGIGEHDSRTRIEVCLGLAWAGVKLDPERNHSGADPVSVAPSTCVVRVLPAQEQQQIARHVSDLLA